MRSLEAKRRWSPTMNNSRTATRFDVSDWTICENCGSNDVFATHEGRGDHAPFDTLVFNCESCGAVRHYTGMDIRVAGGETSTCPVCHSEPGKVSWQTANDQMVCVNDCPVVSWIPQGGGNTAAPSDSSDRVMVRNPDNEFIIVSARDPLGGHASAALTREEVQELVQELDRALDRQEDLDE